MNYRETLDYLYGSLPMFQRIGSAAIKKDLTNTLALCERLGNPHQKFKSIHVAGTNGKGTSAHSLAAILQAAGYKTGLYTSPHLKSFTERIRINGKEIPESHVVEFVQQMQTALEEVKPSFFETTVAMAFDYFARQGVDIAVVEVGLGGRLDSTNIITPEVSLITAIGYDHMDLLGNTLEEIAGEKAGIIKHKVPVVIGSYNKDLDDVFLRKAARESSEVVFARNFYSVENLRYGLLSRFVKLIHLFRSNQTDLELDITGAYYLQNLPGILCVVDILNRSGFVIAQSHVANALAHVKELTGLKGRWQLLQKNPLMICDVGHNEDGLREVFAQLASHRAGKLWIVFGVVSDKDRTHLWEILPHEAHYFFTQADIPRALPAEILLREATQVGFRGEVVPDVNAGIKLALSRASGEDVIFVGGSTFIVAEIENL